MFSGSAQSADRIQRIGLLDYGVREAGRQRLWDAFRQRMRELGYAEGDTIAFDGRVAKTRRMTIPLADIEYLLWAGETSPTGYVLR
jgi:hypothetical protein